MSYEGYVVYLCSNGHLASCDCYDDLDNIKCTCGSLYKVAYNVDTTNDCGSPFNPHLEQLTPTVYERCPVCKEMKIVEQPTYKIVNRPSKKEIKRLEQDKVLKEPTIENVSDGYHTFNELYDHRAVLFATVCNLYKCGTAAWKSLLHNDGTMFDGMFIVGLDSPEGQITYHYNIDPYWDMFTVKELDKAPVWDGHTSEDVPQRLLKLAHDCKKGSN